MNLLQPLISLLLMFCLTASYGQELKNDVERYLLRGQVFSVETLIYNVNEAGETFLREKRHIEFNAEGYKLLEAFYSSTETLKKSIHYEYNQRGDLEERAVFGPNDELQSKKVMEYNPKGQLHRTINYYGEEQNLSYYHTYEYAQAQLVLEKRFNKLNRLSHATQFEYDSDGNEVMKICKDDNGDLTYRLEMEYDKDGNQIEKRRYEQEEGEGTLTQFFYEEGKKVGEEHYDETGNLLYYAERTQDDAGNTEWNYTFYEEEGEFKSRRYTKVHQLGRRMESIDFDKNDEPHLSIYHQYPKIDNQDNWLEKKTFKNGILEKKVLRKIEYY